MYRIPASTLSTVKAWTYSRTGNKQSPPPADRTHRQTGHMQTWHQHISTKLQEGNLPHARCQELWCRHCWFPHAGHNARRARRQFSASGARVGACTYCLCSSLSLLYIACSCLCTLYCCSSQVNEPVGHKGALCVCNPTHTTSTPALQLRHQLPSLPPRKAPLQAGPQLCTDKANQPCRQAHQHCRQVRNIAGRLIKHIYALLSATSTSGRHATLHTLPGSPMYKTLAPNPPSSLGNCVLTASCILQMVRVQEAGCMSTATPPSLPAQQLLLTAAAPCHRGHAHMHTDVRTRLASCLHQARQLHVHQHSAYIRSSSRVLVVGVSTG